MPRVKPTQAKAINRPQDKGIVPPQSGGGSSSTYIHKMPPAVDQFAADMIHVYTPRSAPLSKRETENPVMEHTWNRNNSRSSTSPVRTATKDNTRQFLAETSNAELQNDRENRTRTRSGAASPDERKRNPRARHDQEKDKPDTGHHDNRKKEETSQTNPRAQTRGGPGKPRRKPRDGTGKPRDGAGKPRNGTGKPRDGTGKPETGHRDNRRNNRREGGTSQTGRRAQTRGESGKPRHNSQRTRP